MNVRKFLATVWWIALLVVLPVAAQDAQPSQPAETPTTATPSRAQADDPPVVTRHAITIDGERLAYTATAGTIPLIDTSGKRLASMFFVAYSLEDPSQTRRPVTFAFNGGPGASSMWLHLGLGPNTVPLPEQGTALPRDSTLVDNTYTWLPFTDLVFVDPVGAGYSRAAEGVDESQFYDAVRDIDAAAAFVRRYLTRYDRWRAPKIILGESYGTTRAAALVNRLQESEGIDPVGAILISSVLDFHTIAFDDASVLPYVLALPSYAATAWYHRRLDGDLPQVLREAERWAMQDYLVGLSQGASLPDAQREQLIARLADFTALERDELAQHGLRVSPARFGRLVLGADAPRVGRFDSRVTTAGAARGRGDSDNDPSFFLVTGPWLEALVPYLRENLNYRSDLRYEYLSRTANRSWKWRPPGAQGYLYVADELAEAMGRDPRLRVFAAAGIYDLATPYLTQKYALDQMALDPTLRAHLRFETYTAGHQIYTDPDSAKQLRDDVEGFVRCAASPPCRK